MCEQNTSTLVSTLKLEDTNFNKNLPENCLKCLIKIAIANLQIFKKISEEHALGPLGPIEPFLFLNLLQINSANKNTLKKSQNLMYPL